MSTYQGKDITDYDLVFGIDPSVTSTGLALLLFKGEELVDFETVTVKTSADFQLGRLNYIGYAVSDMLTVAAVTNARLQAVGIEDLPLTGQSAGVTGQSQGVIRQVLGWGGWHYLSETPVYSFVPSSVKKFATGNGRADKKEMIAAAIAHLETKPDEFDDNQADALFIGLMAREKLHGDIAVGKLIGHVGEGYKV